MRYFVYTANGQDTEALFGLPDDARDHDIENHFEAWVMRQEGVDRAYNRASCTEYHLQKAKVS